MGKSSTSINHTVYEAVIGIEVHVQLKTNSKIFCGCPNKFGSQPNTNICEVCAGHPGSLPILNKKAVEFAIMTGLATNCIIRNRSDFARKHYFYPDLPKNYQITQDKKPICYGGIIPITTNGQKKNIHLTRIHLEEDAGKNIHSTSTGKSFVDLNRAGTPLIEIVSEPEITSAQEAKAYLTYLHNLVKYLDVSDANMEQGSFRADVNISVKKKTDKKLGTKVELKNINSFKFICQAIDYEINRQVKALEAHEVIEQETRLWDSKQHKTYVMRTKKEANDYHYFAEPDLTEIVVEEEWLNKIRQHIPELARQKTERFQREYKLSEYESTILTSEKSLADYFEEVVKMGGKAKIACNLILRDLLGYMKEHKIDLQDCLITPSHLAALVTQLEKEVINSHAAQTVFLGMAQTGKMPQDIIKEKDLAQMGSTEELTEIIIKILNDNPENVAAYKQGKERLFGFFVGQAMKITKGKGNPKVISELLKKHIQKMN